MITVGAKVSLLVSLSMLYKEERLGVCSGKAFDGNCEFMREE
jgi:hypothetical protein